MADGGSVEERLEQAVQFKLGGDYDNAEPLLKSIIAEQPNHADAHHELGLIYSFRAMMDESDRHLLRAVQLSPSSTVFLNDYGKNLAMFGEVDKAKIAFEYVLKLDPDNEEANKNLQYLV